MKRILGVVLFLFSLSAVAEEACNFPKPEGAKFSLMEAFLKVSDYYLQAEDVKLALIGCRNNEVAEKDITFGLLKKNGIPDEQAKGVLFIFFEKYEDGKYRFSLDQLEDPWMDGYSEVDAERLSVEPLYDFNWSWPEE